MEQPLPDRTPGLAYATKLRWVRVEHLLDPEPSSRGSQGVASWSRSCGHHRSDPGWEGGVDQVQ